MNIQFMLQDSFSPLMFCISSFHDHVMVVVLMVLSVVLYVLFFSFLLKSFGRFFHKSESLEIFWTVLPCMVLAFLAIPSLLTLYMVEEIVKPVLTIKVIGHQWYWSYEYEDFETVEFDSYLVPIDSILNGEFRLLEVDKKVIIPCRQEVRLIVSSSDVIHSWTIPSMGVKVDAVPGRLNQINLFSNRTGLSYGQCSEICGSFHAFMPICLESVPSNKFLSLIQKI
uniref:cytochrome c oxidase subunit II n=1 Tax=Brueelia nebulosa TaxID=2972756 RepID=UPI0023AA9A1C|nr:cytochrome c oxidase subunit II [Brueelia nebulosa]WCF77113.1 cytochrome c oxidase subunit 2 [Brueelia nebulosa]